MNKHLNLTQGSKRKEMRIVKKHQKFYFHGFRGEAFV